MRLKRSHSLLLLCSITVLVAGQVGMARAQVPGEQAPAIQLGGVLTAPSLPSIPSIAIPPSEGAAPTVPLPAGALETQSASSAEVPKLKSLFFSAEDQARLRDAVATYERNKLTQSADSQNQAQDFLNQLDSAKKKPPEKGMSYPQFYLASLVFHTDTDWVVQVNNQKLGPQTQPDQFWVRVLSIDSEKVMFEWKPFDMTPVNEVWDRTGKSAGVSVDNANGTVQFTLYPNQTFSSYAMRIVEGKVQPVAAESAAMPARAVTPAAALSNVIDAATNKAQKTQELLPSSNSLPSDQAKGLDGLIKTYKKLGIDQ